MLDATVLYLPWCRCEVYCGTGPAHKEKCHRPRKQTIAALLPFSNLMFPVSSEEESFCPIFNLPVRLPAADIPTAQPPFP